MLVACGAMLRVSRCVRARAIASRSRAGSGYRARYHRGRAMKTRPVHDDTTIGVGRARAGCPPAGKGTLPAQLDGSAALLHGSTADASRAVQANGGALAGPDVAATAQRGVAGASAPLPHGEAIQRAFGRHDVSGV